MKTKKKKQIGRQPLLASHEFELKNVKLSEILVDRVKPDAGLKKSMERLGLTSDVVLNELPNLEEGKKYQVIDGRKKINDSLEEGRGEIAARVYKNLPVGVARYVTLVRNLQHSSSPVIEAEAIQAELKKGKTLKEISEVTGISMAVLKQRLALNELPKPVVEKLRRNEISMAVAKKMCKLPKDVQNRIAKEKNITGEVIEQHHREFLNSQIDFKDLDLPDVPKKEMKMKEYHVEAAGAEREMTRKEVIAAIDEMLATLQKGKKIIVTRK